MDILIVDDHPLIHEVLGAIAKSAFPGARVLFATNLEEAHGLARSAVELKLILLDLGLPNCAGIEALNRMRTVYLDVPILIVSAFEEQEIVLQAMRAGAAGYVPKSSRPQVIAGALRLIAEGQIYVPPVVIGKMLQEESTPSRHRLTDRQRDVMRLMLRGLANKEIARELNISENTVKQHLQAVYSHFGVSSRAQAVLAASRNPRAYS